MNTHLAIMGVINILMGLLLYALANLNWTIGNKWTGRMAFAVFPFSFVVGVCAMIVGVLS